MGDKSGLFREEVHRYRLGERVKGTKRTGATARVVVLSGAIFSTTVRC